MRVIVGSFAAIRSTFDQIQPLPSVLRIDSGIDFAPLSVPYTTEGTLGSFERAFPIFFSFSCSSVADRTHIRSPSLCMNPESELAAFLVLTNSNNCKVGPTEIVQTSTENAEINGSCCAFGSSARIANINSAATVSSHRTVFSAAAAQSTEKCSSFVGISATATEEWKNAKTCAAERHHHFLSPKASDALLLRKVHHDVCNTSSGPADDARVVVL